MENIGIPPETFTENQQILFRIVSALLIFLNPLVIKLLNKWKTIDNFPTNLVTAILAFILTFAFKYLLAPDLSIYETILVATAMFTGSTLIGRMITKKPKTS